MPTSPQNELLPHWLARQIRNSASLGKTMDQIATDAGCTSLILGLIIGGHAKAPLDRFPALARALDADLGLLVRMGLRQYWPDDGSFDEVAELIASTDELAMLRQMRSPKKLGSGPHARIVGMLPPADILMGTDLRNSAALPFRHRGRSSL